MQNHSWEFGGIEWVWVGRAVLGELQVKGYKFFKLPFSRLEGKNISWRPWNLEKKTCTLLFEGGEFNFRAGQQT